MSNTDGYFTPPQHIGFLAKKLFENCGEIIDGSIAVLEPDGGGPEENHTHSHNHLFIVTQGEAKIIEGNHVFLLKPGEARLVRGNIPHSCWNNAPTQTIMIGISVTNK